MPRPIYEDQLERQAQSLMDDPEQAAKTVECEWCNYTGFIISKNYHYEEYCPDCGLDGYGVPSSRHLRQR